MADYVSKYKGQEVDDILSRADKVTDYSVSDFVASIVLSDDMPSSVSQADYDMLASKMQVDGKLYALEVGDVLIGTLPSKVLGLGSYISGSKSGEVISINLTFSDGNAYFDCKSAVLKIKKDLTLTIEQFFSSIGIYNRGISISIDDIKNGTPVDHGAIGLETNGDGLSFLANDGTYKKVVLDNDDLVGTIMDIMESSKVTQSQYNLLSSRFNVNEITYLTLGKDSRGLVILVSPMVVFKLDNGDIMIYAFVFQPGYVNYMHVVSITKDLVYNEIIRGAYLMANQDGVISLSAIESGDGKTIDFHTKGDGSKFLADNGKYVQAPSTYDVTYMINEEDQTIKPNLTKAQYDELRAAIQANKTIGTHLVPAIMNGEVVLNNVFSQTIDYGGTLYLVGYDPVVVGGTCSIVIESGPNYTITVTKN